jgi:hypothetical protein
LDFVESEITIRPLDDPYLDGSYEDNLSVDQLDVSILKYPPLERLNQIAHECYTLEKTIPSPTASSQLSIAGTWSGFCSSNNVTDTCGLIQITITADTEQGSFVGCGVDVTGSLFVRGKYLEDHSFEAIFTRSGHSDSVVPKYFVGKRDMASRVIKGEWGAEMGTAVGTLTLHPIPASLCRFRFESGGGLNIARVRWLSAGAAVLDEVQRRLWSWRFFMARFATRKDYTRLYQRRYLSDILSDRESKALVMYERNLLPEDVRFYRAIARSQHGGCIHP